VLDDPHVHRRDVHHRPTLAPHRRDVREALPTGVTAGRRMHHNLVGVVDQPQGVPDVPRLTAGLPPTGGALALRVVA